MIIFLKAKVKGFTRIRNGVASYVQPHERRDTQASARNLTPEQKSTALKLYKDGRGIKEIANTTGMHVATVTRIAKKAGIVRTVSEAQAVRAAREPIGRSDIGKKGAFHSEKNGTWFATDSHYEYARMNQLENDNDVISWRRCSDRIPYQYSGKSALYVPDIEVIRRDGSVSVEEIKPIKFVKDQKNQAKFEAAREFYGNAKQFYVVTETEIGRKNIDCLADVGHSEIPLDERKRKRIESVNRYVAKKSPEERAAMNEAARLRELAKRRAMNEEEREAYNKAARDRRAAKKAQKLTKSLPLILFFDYTEFMNISESGQ